MWTFNDKIQEVKIHLNNGDLHVGYRKLLDCILDTQDMVLYQSVITIEEWKEVQVIDDPSTLKAKYEDMLYKTSLKQPIANDNNRKLVTVRNIEKSYGRNKFSISDINLDIYAGQVIGLVGENGNGKTTLLRILAKEISYDKGDVIYSLKDNYENLYDLRTKLTYIPQRTPKWYGSLLNNLKYCASSYGIKGEMNHYFVLMMIIRFGLWKYRHLKWNELSSRYKMRFELARTFLRTPEVLFLDEPLANLDVVAQQLILEDLKNMARSISNPLGIILSSQQLFEVEKIADAVVFLKNGRPYNISSAVHQNKDNNRVIELEIKNDKNELEKALADLAIDSIRFNGGMYTIEFSDNIKAEEIIQSLISHHIQIQYYRDISNSTKRLFI